MTIDNLLFFAKQHIHSDHAKILLAELLQKNPLELLIHLEETVPPEIEELYKKEVLALQQGKPLQYVIGNVNFYGQKFYINENVLIPRFETEELVENTINYINKHFPQSVDILDLGCGSGVIGLTLEKKLSPKSVDLVDISSKALEVAHKNCENFHSKANLIQSDMFQNIIKKYDLIISNPPYIKTKEEIEPIVKENEPSIALYAGEEGLDCYEKIIKDLNNHMKNRCLVAFEIGQTQAEPIKNLINKYLQDVEIKVQKDLSNKDRMLFIFKNL